MCGIAGVVDSTRSTDLRALREQVTSMAATLRSRGPDDGDAWADEAAGVALGHRRLSIIDLSPEGRQPMVSACGRYVLSYNGEVYNFRRLRDELERLGHRFRGHSDTEVILGATTEWGFRQALDRFDGMFAIALWDRELRHLHLVRDRLGKKPLYYGWAGRTLLFGSQLKALRAHPDFEGAIDRDAITLFLRHSYIPSPYSIYNQTRKLAPGTIVTFTRFTPTILPEPETYWSAVQAAESGQASPLDLSERETIDALDSILREAVADRMVADVPLGAFLSGGIDSSLVAALMQAQSAQPIRTFTIGFKEARYDEAPFAKSVAAHLGTDHRELYVTPQAAMEVVPDLPSLYDEPFADPSAIPTFLVARFARRDVTVCLSGDGGDEVFGGYDRYSRARSLWNRTRRLPASARSATAAAIQAVPPRAWDRLAWLFALLPPRAQTAKPGHRAHKLAEMLRARRPEELYRHLVSHCRNPTDIVRHGIERSTPLTEPSRWADLDDFTERMMCLDMMTYLPDDILVKVDRASMAVSLEARAPILDHRVVEWGWRIPASLKVRGDRGKWLLRELLYRYVPRDLVERPKMGFAVPIDSWLRGAMRDWAEALLHPRRLRDEGWLDPDPIRRLWQEHLSGKFAWHYHLWDVLMFQAWLAGQ